MVSGLCSRAFFFSLFVCCGVCHLLQLLCGEMWFSGPTCPVCDLLDFLSHAVYEWWFFFFESTGCAPDQHRAGGKMSGEGEWEEHLGSRRRSGRHLIFASWSWAFFRHSAFRPDPLLCSL